MAQSTGVLFVCHGNICRSPIAEGVFRHLVEQQGRGSEFTVDSAGIIGYHAGEAPHRQSTRVCRDHGIDITAQRSRQLVPADLARFAWIFTMDDDNQRGVMALTRSNGGARVQLLLEAGGDARREVPDPYYGGPEGFDEVYAMILGACETILRSQLAPGRRP
jgi:protein-tyrosine phosphatase